MWLKLPVLNLDERLVWFRKMVFSMSLLVGRLRVTVQVVGLAGFTVLMKPAVTAGTVPRKTSVLPTRVAVRPPSMNEVSM